MEDMVKLGHQRTQQLSQVKIFNALFKEMKVNTKESAKYQNSKDGSSAAPYWSPRQKEQVILISSLKFGPKWIFDGL